MILLANHQQVGPEYGLDAIRPRYRGAASAAEFGSISKTVLDRLRRAAKPHSAEDIGAGSLKSVGQIPATPSCAAP
jgi:hypothetical protein